MRPAQDIVRVLHSSDNDVGTSLVANEVIQAGQAVLEYKGKKISFETMQAILLDLKAKGIIHRYFMRHSQPSWYINGLDCNTFNPAIHVNHSCQDITNLSLHKTTVNGNTKMILFAKKNIQPGQELLFNYQWELRDDTTPCRCASPNCTRTIARQPTQKKQKKVPVVDDINQPIQPMRTRQQTARSIEEQNTVRTHGILLMYIYAKHKTESTN